MDAEIERWLRDWFHARGVADAKAASPVVDYFESKWIDSLAVIELIEAAEDRFAVHFKEDSFTDRRFSSLAGLTQIIGELRRD